MGAEERPTDSVDGQLDGHSTEKGGVNPGKDSSHGGGGLLHGPLTKVWNKRTRKIKSNQTVKSKFNLTYRGLGEDRSDLGE